MDGVTSVVKQQQSLISSKEIQGRAPRAQEQTVQQTKQKTLIKELQEAVSKTETNINSKEQVQELVNQLNKAMAPISTNLRFGVDSEDIFFVSIIDAETSKMIRRFPAEQAIDFLPKMQEVVGMLFDSRG
ncbi:MAG: flagellar biosynthesis protein FlaG [Sulfurimonas sp.]|nr:MAG: flagellar biosynthesis protein FlaG [Sulfurimonas sp.]